jgi:hypothetical protein
MAFTVMPPVFRLQPTTKQPDRGIGRGLVAQQLMGFIKRLSLLGALVYPTCYNKINGFWLLANNRQPPHLRQQCVSQAA